MRAMFQAAVWLAIVALAIVAWRSGRYTRRCGLAMALSAATLWSVPYFGSSLSRAPGDVFLLLALAAVAAWPRLARQRDTLVPYAAAFGAIVVFFEMLTGQLPIAVAWLAALVLAAVRDGTQPGPRAPLAMALTAVCAFTAGAVATVAVKQGIAMLLTDHQPGGDFVAQLQLYMSIPPSEFGVPGIFLPFARLIRHSDKLTYGYAWAGYLVVVALAASWLVAAWRGWRQRHSGYGRDVLTLALAALVPVGWVLLLPNHTNIHAAFMVRMLVLPAALVPLALWWPQPDAPTGPGRSTTVY